jgi:hypothetical protein
LGRWAGSKAQDHQNPNFCENSLKEMSKTQRFDEGIFVKLAQKTHVPRTWVHFRLIRQSNWMEGSGLQIFAIFLGAIEAI